jgi:hypothetical protein
MQREVSPLVWVAALVVTIAVLGWIGWRTLVPRPPMSREEYIKARNSARMEIIQRAREREARGQ